MFLDLVGFTMVFVDIQFRAEELHAHGWMIGVILASTFIVQTLVSPWWGAKSDQFGRKAAFIACTSLSAASMVMYGLSGNLWMILISRILAGLGGANVAVAQASVVDDSDTEYRTVVLGRLGAAQTAGMIAGPALGGLVGHFVGSQILGLMGGALSATGVILVAAFAQMRGKQDISRKPKFGFGPLVGEFPRLIPFVVIASVAWFSLSTLEGTFGRLLEAVYGYGRREMGLLFSFESLVSLIVQGAVLVWLTKTIKDRNLLTFGYLAQGLGLALTPFMPNTPWLPAIFPLFVVSFIYSAGSAVANPTLNGLASHCVDEERQGELFGVLHSARSIGFAVGPLIGGILFDWKPAAPYLLAGTVCIIAAILVVKTVPHGSTANRSEP